MSAVRSNILTIYRGFHTTSICNEIRLLSKLRVVDNSPIGKAAMAEGRPPKCIHVYNPLRIGRTGDRVLMACKGEKVKGIIVGLKKPEGPFVPRFDTNNVVLIDDFGTPLGTRIHVPIPNMLRTILKKQSKKKVDYTKILAIATRFV